MDNIRFLEPAFLWLFVPWGVLVVLWIFGALIKIWKRPRPTYGSRHPLIGKIKLWGLFVLPALALMILSLAKPKLDESSFNPSRGDIEVIIVIDRSISARGTDVKESRLEIAKREAANIEPLLRQGDKAALFVFGKEAHRKIFLTERYDETFNRIYNIDFPKTLKGDGTVWDSDFAGLLEGIYHSMDRQDAFSEGQPEKNYRPKKRSNRIVFIFSDGGDQFRKAKLSADLPAEYKADYIKRLNNALKEFKRRGLKIYPIGIGTIAGVDETSLLKGYKPEEDYPKELLESWKGKKSRLDKENLLFLAKSVGVNPAGVWTVENSSTTVKNYLSSAIGQNRSTLFEYGQNEDKEKLWQYLLILAAGFIVAGIATYPFSGYLRKNKRLNK